MTSVRQYAIEEMTRLVRRVSKGAADSRISELGIVIADLTLESMRAFLLKSKKTISLLEQRSAISCVSDRLEKSRETINSLLRVGPRGVSLHKLVREVAAAVIHCLQPEGAVLPNELIQLTSRSLLKPLKLQPKDDDEEPPKKPKKDAPSDPEAEAEAEEPTRDSRSFTDKQVEAMKAAEARRREEPAPEEPPPSYMSLYGRRAALGAAALAGIIGAYKGRNAIRRGVGRVAQHVQLNGAEYARRAAQRVLGEERIEAMRAEAREELLGRQRGGIGTPRTAHARGLSVGLVAGRRLGQETALVEGRRLGRATGLTEGLVEGRRLGRIEGRLARDPAAVSEIEEEVFGPTHVVEEDPEFPFGDLGWDDAFGEVTSGEGLGALMEPERPDYAKELELMVRRDPGMLSAALMSLRALVNSGRVSAEEGSRTRSVLLLVR